jgi:hypothetical protein
MLLGSKIHTHSTHHRVNLKKGPTGNQGSACMADRGKVCEIIESLDVDGDGSLSIGEVKALFAKLLGIVGPSLELHHAMH